MTNEETISWSRALSFSTGCDDVLDKYREENHNERAREEEQVEYTYCQPAAVEIVSLQNHHNNQVEELQPNNQYQVAFQPEEPRPSSSNEETHQEDFEENNSNLSAYTMKRRRNNLAVRKSREKAKKRFEELRRAERRLEEQNAALARKADELEESLNKLKTYYNSIAPMHLEQQPGMYMQV